MCFFFNIPPGGCHKTKLLVPRNLYGKYKKLKHVCFLVGVGHTNIYQFSTKKKPTNKMTTPQQYVPMPDAELFFRCTIERQGVKKAKEVAKKAEEDVKKAEQDVKNAEVDLKIVKEYARNAKERARKAKECARKAEERAEKAEEPLMRWVEETRLPLTTADGQESKRARNN